MLSRRGFLLTGASAAAMLSRVEAGVATSFETPLPIPRLIDATANAGPVSLVAARGTHAYRAGQAVSAFGYSAPVLGPVVRIARGKDANFVVENRTESVTTVHWHGLLIPSELDGGPHNAIAPGASWQVTLRADQPETTAWFHPHPHGHTARQVYSGLAGMLIIEDGTGERAGLPRAYGVDDIPLVLQDRWFDRRGASLYNPSPMDVMAGYRGDTIIVNGVVAPVVRVPAGLVRLRLLNAANARIFDLQFGDRRTFHVIASDGGYLATPVPMQRLEIAPGERYEALVDFSTSTEIVLETGPDDNQPMMGMMGGGRAAAGGAVLKFSVNRDLPAVVKSAPRTLAQTPRLDRANVVARRQFLLNDMMMGGMGGMGGGFGPGGRAGGPAMAINGRPFEMERIDVETKRGTMELWRIAAQSMAHPFHVHGVQFQIVSLDRRPPPPYLRGWKDTVLVNREAEILIPFTQPATSARPFMFHCHILEHEDAGMMGQFTCV